MLMALYAHSVSTLQQSFGNRLIRSLFYTHPYRYVSLTWHKLGHTVKHFYVAKIHYQLNIMPSKKMLGFALAMTLILIIAFFLGDGTQNQLTPLPYYVIPCDGSCNMHLHFCGYFAPDLPQGTYCCTDTGCRVKFTYSQRFYISKDSDAIILHHSGGWKLQSLLR